MSSASLEEGGALSLHGVAQVPEAAVALRPVDEVRYLDRQDRVRPDRLCRRDPHCSGQHLELMGRRESLPDALLQPLDVLVRGVRRWGRRGWSSALDPTLRIMRPSQPLFEEANGQPAAPLILRKES